MVDKFFLKKVFKDINHFYLEEGILFFLNEKNDLFINESLELNNVFFYNIAVKNKRIYYHEMGAETKNTYSYAITKSGIKQYISYQNVNIIANTINDQLLAIIQKGWNEQTKIIDYAFYDLNKKEEIGRFGYGNIFDKVFIHDNYIYIYNYGEEELLKFKYGEWQRKWWTSVKTYCRHNTTKNKLDFIGIYEGDLIIYKEGQGILALDTATGQPLWEVNYIAQDNSFARLRRELPKVVPNIVDDKIYFLDMYTFGEIDLKIKKAIIHKDFRDDFFTKEWLPTDNEIELAKQKAWNFQQVTIRTDGRLNFIGKKGRNGILSSEYIGIFNPQTASIDWTYYLEECFDHNLPLSTENQIIGMSGLLKNRKLYVFEKLTET